MEDLQPLDYTLAFGLGVVALFLGLNRIRSWEFAFVGDEWGFYALAREMLSHPVTHSLFGLTDSNAYHTEFSSWLQAGVMWLAGEDVVGWRLSALLPLVFSVPALYAFAFWLAGCPAAVLGASALAGSHLLLGFTKVAYNNSQALLVLTAALALFAFATPRPVCCVGFCWASPSAWAFSSLARAPGRAAPWHLIFALSLALVHPLSGRTADRGGGWTRGRGANALRCGQLAWVAQGDAGAERGGEHRRRSGPPVAPEPGGRFPGFPDQQPQHAFCGGPACRSHHSRIDAGRSVRPGRGPAPAHGTRLAAGQRGVLGRGRNHTAV